MFKKSNILSTLIIVLYVVSSFIILYKQDDIKAYLNKGNEAKYHQFKKENKEKLEFANELAERHVSGYSFDKIQNANIVEHFSDGKRSWEVSGIYFDSQVKYKFNYYPKYNNDHSVSFYKYNDELYTNKSNLLKAIKADNESAYYNRDWTYTSDDLSNPNAFDSYDLNKSLNDDKVNMIVLLYPVIAGFITLFTIFGIKNIRKS